MVNTSLLLFQSSHSCFTSFFWSAYFFTLLCTLIIPLIPIFLTHTYTHTYHTYAKNTHSHTHAQTHILPHTVSPKSPPEDPSAHNLQPSSALPPTVFKCVCAFIHSVHMPGSVWVHFCVVGGWDWGWGN